MLLDYRPAATPRRIPTRLTDSAGWGAFLKLLCKYRRRQPINGVLVALERTGPAHDGRAGARAPRRRDSRAAAMSSAGSSASTCRCTSSSPRRISSRASRSSTTICGQAARAQVWGTTFPLALTESGRATEAFGREFDALIERLQQRVPARLEGSGIRAGAAPFSRFRAR